MEKITTTIIIQISNLSSLIDRYIIDWQLRAKIFRFHWEMRMNDREEVHETREDLEGFNKGVWYNLGCQHINDHKSFINA